MWRSGAIRPVATASIVNEYLRVLAYPKFRLTKAEIEYLLRDEILPFFEVIDERRYDAYVASDHDDDKFIWCAMHGRAECIISGDAHLLSCAASLVAVLAPSGFLKRFASR